MLFQMKTTLPSTKSLAASIFILTSFLTKIRISIGKKSVAKTIVSLTSVAILLISSTVFTMLGSAAITNSQSNDSCKKLDIAGISESGHNANSVATNAIDMKSNTRWAEDVMPSYLQVDLGQKTFLCSIDISWYRGEFRSYNFVISVSDDGINFKDVVSAQSTGETSSPERYSLANSEARYVRTTVYGNTENDDWASINEMSVNGQVCSAPLISGVTAKGDDGNVPQNTLDSNLNTRWSNLGFPSWIQYDLGESQPICNVDIAWYRGNFRVNAFTISGSNDGINFTPIFSGQSSGKTIGLERYDVRDTMSRYLRITVTGNTENSWSSISEVRINGGAETPPPPPPPPTEICNNGIDDDGDGKIDSEDPDCAQPPPPPTEICNNGIDDDGDGKIDSEDPDCAQPPPPPPTGTDPFGIKKIYPTKSGGEEWFMDMTDGRDPRSNPPSLRKNSDESFKVTSSKV